MQTLIAPTMTSQDILVKLEEIIRISREQKLSSEQKEALIRDSIEQLPEQLAGIPYSDLIRLLETPDNYYRDDTGDTHITYLQEIGNDNLCDFKFKNSHHRLPELILYHNTYTTLLDDKDRGFHHHVEVRQNQKDTVAALLKDFQSQFPVVIVEVPNDKSSFCASEEYNETIRENIANKAQNVLFSDGEACKKLKNFADATKGLHDAAWAMFYNKSYLTKTKNVCKEMENTPHYHIVACPGKKKKTETLLKAFDADCPVIVTEMSVPDYLDKLYPSTSSPQL